jgi:hypothetical protein
MVRKVNAVTPDQLKKDEGISKPTIESRLSGVEYRLNNPQRSLERILAEPDNAFRFREEVERVAVEMQLASLVRVHELEVRLERLREVSVLCDDATPTRENNMGVSGRGETVVQLYRRLKRAASSPPPNRRERIIPEAAFVAEKESLARPIIWGALLGAALALAVIAIINPGALHRPVKPPTGMSAVVVTPVVTPVATAATTIATAAATVPLTAGTSNAPFVWGAHAFLIEGAKGCWISVGWSVDANPILFEAPGWVAREDSIQLQAETLRVRDGCPGKLRFYVDGNQRYPENQSAKPDVSEVVGLP